MLNLVLLRLCHKSRVVINRPADQCQFR
jgi:hypothetical protein